MANQQPNQRFDPFAGAHGQFGNNTGLNQRQRILIPLESRAYSFKKRN